MMSFFLVCRHAFGRALRGKRVFGLIALASLPVLVAVLTVRSGSTAQPEQFVQFAVILAMLQIAVPFAALLLGVAVLGEEIEGRTITFLFTRPLPRWFFFVGRMAGFACAFSVVLVVALFAAAAIFRIEADLPWRDVAWTAAICVGGFLAYIAFFAALRTFFEKALYIGFLITFILEITISKMPFGGLTRLSLWHHLTVLTARLYDNRFLSFEGSKNIMEHETVGGSIAVVAGVFVFCVVVGAWRVRTHEVRIPAAVG